jgi:hypothetical protein
MLFPFLGIRAGNRPDQQGKAEKRSWCAGGVFEATEGQRDAGNSDACFETVAIAPS